MKRNDGTHPTESTIVLPGRARNEMMLPGCLFTLFLTHVGHLANVKNNQRRFAPTLAHITGIGGPLHRNTHGHRIGRLVVYGSLGWQLKPAGASIQVFPGHVDGAAGLKPLGSFCLGQALTLAIPAAFLAVWSFLIPAWPDIAVRTRYRVWVHPYIALLGLALLLEILAFVLPMLWFHREMGNQKQHLLAEADEVSRQIRTLSDQLALTQSHEEREALKEELSFKTSRFREIESMPTWPVDLPLVRRFAFANAPLVLPVFAEVFGLHEDWVKLMEQVLDKSSS